MLDLSRQERDDLGQWLLSVVNDHYDGVGDKSAVNASNPSGDWRPDHGAPAGAMETVELLGSEIFGRIAHLDHPRFFGFVPSPSNYLGFVADALVAGYNPFAGSWLEAAGPAQIESETVGFLARMLSMPATTEGSFVSGGTVANLSAVAIARRWGAGPRADSGTVYFSSESHSSVPKTLRLTGVAEDRWRRVGVDDVNRMSVAHLQERLRDDVAEGSSPLLIVANCGSTSTGAVDELRELRSLADRYGAWLHVDGAYGAAAALSEALRPRVDGVGQADSVSVDGHKWLFQPYECGCILTRHTGLLEATFSSTADYLGDLQDLGSGVDFMNRGLQMSRSLKALKLWLTVRVFGCDAIARAIDRGVALAELAEQRVRGSSVFEIVTPGSLGILTFRVQADDPTSLHRNMVGRLTGSGFAFVGSTRVHGEHALRMCCINPRTTEQDIEDTLKRLEEYAVDCACAP